MNYSGAGVFYFDPSSNDDCHLYNGFTLWKNLDFGLYYIHTPSLEVRNSIFVENGVGMLPFVMGPSSTGHQMADKYANIINNIWIGKTSSFDNSLDRADTSDHNIQLSVFARGDGSWARCGKIGLQMTVFTNGGNGITSHPFTGIMSYQTIKGITTLTGEFNCHLMLILLEKE